MKDMIGKHILWLEKKLMVDNTWGFWITLILFIELYRDEQDQSCTSQDYLGIQFEMNVVDTSTVSVFLY